MGRGGWRFGAGRPGYRGKAEQCFRVDVRWLRRNGYLRSSGGTLTYSVGGEQVGQIGYRIRDGAITLSYALNGQPKEQRVPLTYTACNYGGRRAWLACPHCSRRCEVLYCRRGGFYCRTCAHVSYESQSEDSIGRSWRVQAKAEAKLGEHWRRPKGMHRRTYERLVATVMQCEEAREHSLAKFIAKHPGLFGKDGRPL